MDEREHLKELLKRYKENLRKLELEAARYGGYDFSPLPIKNQIDQQREEIERLEARLSEELEIEAKEPEAPGRVKEPEEPGRRTPYSRTLEILIGLFITVVGGVIVAWIIREGELFTTKAMPTATGTPAPTSAPTDTPVLAPDINPIDGAKMVYVPVGEFTMGGIDSDQYTVNLDSAFWIYKTEVTNAQYRKCVEAGACELPRNTKYYDDPDYADHPVVYVDWYQARAYCEWARGRLPTETEWEKTARGTDGRIYPWGNTFDCAGANLDDDTEIDIHTTNCDDGYKRTTAPVGSYPAGVSPYGALDMAGNVWEWTSSLKAPEEDEVSGERVLRGGSWTYGQGSARCAYRYAAEPDDSDSDIGFRVVVPGPSVPTIELDLWFEVKASDAEEFVRGNEEGEYKSGDIFRFHFRPTADGYAYLFNIDTQGKFTPFWPDYTGQNAARVRGGEDYHTGEFRLDQSEGWEQVFAIVSPEPFSYDEDIERYLEPLPLPGGKGFDPVRKRLDLREDSFFHKKATFRHLK